VCSKQRKKEFITKCVFDVSVYRLWYIFREQKVNTFTDPKGPIISIILYVP